MGDQSSLLGLPCSCELDACSCIRRARYACFLEVLGVVFITCPLEYWLSSLKVATIVVFIIIGILVNVGVNRDHQYIGAHYWHIPGAPFVGGFGGFARVFVTASFACSYLFRFHRMIHSSKGIVDGGTESLGITAGETKNPSRNMPRVVKFVFWRCVVVFIPFA